jgi:dTDP-4-amino-4,6-dideoxy-D-galactose acyltransferase
MTFTHTHTFAARDKDLISASLERWQFNPFATHSGLESPDLFAITTSRVIRTLESEDGAAWMMVQQNQTLGFTSLSMLRWDSEQLGFAAGRIDYLVAEGGYPQQHKTKKALLRHAINEATRRGILHLSIRVDANDLSSLHVLEEAGFITVDNILTFALKLKDHHSEAFDHNFTIRPATMQDADRAGNLALGVYSKDRFHSDPRINKDRADQLHAEWIRNSCLGKAADVVFLAESDEQLLGFVTCKVQRNTAETVGTIVLIGCDENARGRGVGQALTLTALDWFKQADCDLVEVGTQLRNLPASRLYEKCGFRLAGSSASLRLVL